MKKTKYLVRPNDFHIFEVDESNGCYRSYSNKDVTDSSGWRPNAYAHFTFEILTEGYGFFPIEESELEEYKKRSDTYMNYRLWCSRPDGHGGCKGGTFEEYLKLNNMPLNTGTLGLNEDDLKEHDSEAIICPECYEREKNNVVLLYGGKSFTTIEWKLLEALGKAVRGLEWRMERYPETIDNSDHETLDEWKELLSGFPEESWG
jgi:hypothetical protein